MEKCGKWKRALEGIDLRVNLRTGKSMPLMNVKEDIVAKVSHCDDCVQKVCASNVSSLSFLLVSK